MGQAAQSLDDWAQELLAPLERLGAPPGVGEGVDDHHADLPGALQYAAALGLASKGRKDLLKWAARFGFLAEDPSDDLLEGLAATQTKVLTRRDQIWRDWLPFATSSLPTEGLTAILGERRAGRFQEEVAAALERARRVDALPELVRLAGAGSAGLSGIVERFVRATDEPFALFCVLAGVVPPSADPLEHDALLARHRELLAGVRSRDETVEGAAANGDPVALLTALALPRGKFLEFVSGLAPEILNWLGGLLPALRARLGEGSDPRPGTPDHELRRRLYAFVMAMPEIPVPRRLETQAATAIRNELKEASPAGVREVLGTMDASRRSDLLNRSLDGDDQTFDVDRARGILLWFRSTAPAAQELPILQRAVGTLGSHLGELALDVFLAQAIHFPRVAEPLLDPLGEALKELPPSARDALVQDLLPALDAVAEQLAPRLDAATRAQLVRSAGSEAHRHALRFADLALAAKRRISWAELDVLIEILDSDQLQALAERLGERLTDFDGGALDRELAELRRPERLPVLVAAPASILPRLSHRHPEAVGVFLRELEAVASGAAQAPLWTALVDAGPVGEDLLRAFVDAGGVPPAACSALPEDLAEGIARHLAERCELLEQRTEKLDSDRAERIASTWQSVSEGVALAVGESADLLVGTRWDATPIRSLGAALANSGGNVDGEAEQAVPDRAAGAEVLPFDTAVLEGIGALDEYTEELEAASELVGLDADGWDRERLKGLGALLRLLDARGWGERADPSVRALLESAFADPSLVHGLRAFVASAIAGEPTGEVLSRLSAHLQRLVLRRAYVDDAFRLEALKVGDGRAPWLAWMLQELGVGVEAEGGSSPEPDGRSAWREVQTLAEDHRRRQRAERRAATGLERTTTDVLRRVAEELRASMDEVEVVLRAYSALRQGLSAVGLAPAVSLVELVREQVDLDVGVVRLVGQPREAVELLTGGFAQPGGPILVPASGVPRGRSLEGQD